jgi:hypothetical protein
MKKTLFLTFVLLMEIFSGSLFAQKNLCHGVVIDPDSVPLPFVTVKNLTKGIHFFSDSLGNYEFTCDRLDYIIFSLTGYKDFSITGDSFVNNKKKFIMMHELKTKNSEASIQAQNKETLGYSERDEDLAYKLSNYRQSSIIVAFNTHRKSFMVEDFGFYLFGFDKYLDLKLRVTICDNPRFTSDKSYSTTVPAENKDSWYTFDLSQSNLVIKENMVYVKLDFLDNGLELCRYDSMVNVLFITKPNPDIQTKKNTFKYYDAGYCLFADQMPVYKDNLYCRMTIKH